MTDRLEARPLTLAQANALVSQLHRHHKPTRGHRFSIGAYAGDAAVGAVIVGRPVARMVDQYAVCEVTRLVTDGTRNACSFLYARAAQAAQAMGFARIQTYTLPEEGGVSLRASGWECEGTTSHHAVGWQSREGRRDDQPTCVKVRWSKRLKKVVYTE